MTASRSSITMKNSMSAFESNNPFDLLGQAPLPAPPVELHGSNEPQLELGWGQFHQGIASNFVELFRRAGFSKNLLSASFFQDVWIERRLPRRAIFAAALWHIAFIAMPLPQIPGPKTNPAFGNAQLTWSGQIEDFPLVEIPAAKAKAMPRVTHSRPPTPEGAGAFHPRQRIFTDPVHPTHPHQTLINPAAPPLAPKLLPILPNMVQLGQSAAPPRPHLEISQETLKKLRPREKHFKTNPNAPAPEMQISEQRTDDLTLAMSNAGPERPKLQINSGVAPRVSQRKQDGDSRSRAGSCSAAHFAERFRANADCAFRYAGAARSCRATARQSRRTRDHFSGRKKARRAWRKCRREIERQWKFRSKCSRRSGNEFDGREHFRWRAAQRKCYLWD